MNITKKELMMRYDNKKDIFISSVIVLYNPDLVQLEKNFEILKNQVQKVIYIDNSDKSCDKLNFFDDEKIVYLYMNQNVGIAKAQNVGIDIALGNESDFIFFLDQDSTVTHSMLDNLVYNYENLRFKGIKIAAIGPSPINIQTGKPYKSRIRRSLDYLDIENQILNVKQIISSGCMIHSSVIKDVGYMDESLFIDGVDHEWCWRAKSKGYQIGLSAPVFLNHMLGEGDRFIFGIRVAVTSPFRVYYQYRNYIYLCGKSYVPIYWKMLNGFKYLVKAFYYPLFVYPRTSYCIRIWKGIYNGFGMSKIDK